jgi:alkaline phosphatase D
MGLTLKKVIVILGITYISSFAVAEKKSHKMLSKPDLATSLKIFNMWGVQPENKQQILKYAYQYLSADSSATMTGLAVVPEFQALCKSAEITHLGGPILGNISSTGVSVWIRTIKPSMVSIVVEIDGHSKIFGPVASTEKSDLSVVIPVTGLKPGKELPYQVIIDGQTAKIDSNAMIRTVPSGTEDVRIAFGSCWHRWGLGNPQMSSLIQNRKPSALLMIGDIAVQDRKDHTGLHRYDFLLRDLTPAWKELSSSIPVYTSWDDHDYYRNDKAGLFKGFTETDRSNIRKVFTQSWVNPQYGFGDDKGGVFLRTRIGPCDIIMTDNRYFRKKGEGKGNFLGIEQTNWLKEQLLDCKGPFIILSCGTMWSDYVSEGKDSWGKFDQEVREEIFRVIEENQIPGVLLISGDRHGARGFTIPRYDNFSFYEFGAASYGGRIGPPAKDTLWTEQFYGIASEYAYCEFEFNTTKSDPEVTFRLIGENGTLIHEMMLTRSKLTPTKRK